MPLVNFIQRYLHDHPAHNWDQLKAELSGRFAEITDPQHAFTLLQKVKQKPDENVQLYAERLLALTEEALLIQQTGIQPIQTQLMGYFIDGRAYDYLKIKVMRDNPATLADAVNIAMNEQNLRRRFDLRKDHTNDILRHESPMEVDNYRPDKRCFNCHKKGHLANKCKVKK